MELKIKVPKLSEEHFATVEDVTVVEGQDVKKGAELVTLSSGKVVRKITSPCDGRVKRVYAAVGEAVRQGDVLCVIETEGIPAEISTSSGAVSLLPPVEGRRKLVGIRGKTAERLASVFQSYALVTQAIEADVTDLVGMLRKLKKVPGARVSMTSAIVKASALALSKHKSLNAHIVGSEVLIFGKVNMGVAVETPYGLVVVVVRDVGGKDVFRINAEINELARKAREGKLEEKDVIGSTFTVSNLGMYATEVFTPIPNPPEVAILGVGRPRRRLERASEGIVEREKIWLSLTYDHRAVDGAPVARFLGELERILSRPEKIFPRG